MKLHVEDLLGNYHKLIMDPVHGGIPLLSHEVAIIDHPLFQRLRFICQNDILSLVFPGATHSRFLHSIGAMHVGGRMFMALVENCLKILNSQGQQGIDGDTLEAISYFNRLVRSACLLHDSGHCSFSHQFSRTGAIITLLKEPRRQTRLWDGVDQTILSAPACDMMEHEHYSLRAAYEILNSLSHNPQTPELADIIGLMETSDTAPSSRFEKHAHALRKIIHGGRSSNLSDTAFNSGLQGLLSHLVSGELDADRADYMLRDGFHSSVTIGGFNLDHLLSNLHFGICEQTGWMGLAIAEKGLGSLEDFVYSRHQMYRQVYAHKTAQGFDWLLRAAIDEVMQKSEIRQYVEECLSDINEFKYLTDNYFWEAFRQFAKDNPNSYSECILDRIKMPYLATRTNLSDQEQLTYQDFLTKENGDSEASIVTSSITARFTKIKEGFSDIKVLYKSTPVQPETYKLIANTSQFFAKFTDDRITHFYVDPVHRANA